MLRLGIAPGLPVLICCALTATWAGGARAQGQAVDGLFTDAPAPAAVTAAEATSIRRRWVRIDVPRLQDQPLVQGQAAPVNLNLFPDVSIVAVRDRVERTATGFVWVGRIAGVAESSVTFAVNGSIVAGSVTTPATTFSIRYAADDVHVIEEVDRGAFPRESPPLVPEPGAAAGADSPAAASDDGSTIDILVVYTPSARAARGGTSAIEALIDLGVSETNQAYANSGAIQRLRLVHKAEIAYVESGDMLTDLSRLRLTADGHMDGVHSLRNTYGADLVHLIENSPDSCGFAYIMTNVSASFASSAFGITHYTCVSPNYTFAHELGHNMGIHHDIHVTGSSTTGAFAYSRGYVNQAAFASGASSSKRWRDILAYNDQCTASGFFCTRVLYFSNPANTLTGDPMGHAATADGVRTLNETRTTIANFRTAVDTPTMSISDVSVWEGNSTRTATFVVTLSAAAPSTVTVNFATADDTATASADYVASSGSISIPAGATTRTIGIVVNGDAAAEAAETFRVVLSGASGATISDATGVATIRNDDFTDQPLAAGVVIKAVHVAELRTMINDVRAEGGLSAFTFSDATLVAQSTPVRAVHVTELRTALAQAYSAAGQAAPTYSDPVLTAGVTVAKATHISELRTAVQMLLP